MHIAMDFAGTTKKSKIEHIGQIPRKMIFELVERKDTNKKRTSNVTVVYAGGEPGV